MIREEFIREELQRILSSAAFSDAERLQRFLTFVVEETLAGAGDRLKESVIGVEVFGREPGYDPKVDPIVRVQARRLRSRLDAYYSSVPPAGEKITLPKGGYLPVFETVPEPAREIPAALPPADSPAPPRQQKFARARAWFAIATTLAAAGTAAVVMARHQTVTDSALPRFLTTYSGYQTRPAISPDGRTVAFGWAGPDDSNSDIYVQRLDADSPRRLTTSPSVEANPVWLPDGDQIAFARVEGPNRIAIVTLALLGGGERRIAQIEADDQNPPRIEWSPDGKHLYTSERGAGETAQHIIEIDAVAGGRRTLTHPPAASPGDDEPALSPDGNWLAFRRTVESSIADVFVMRTSGGEPRAVTHDHSGIIGMAWERDSRALIVSSRRQSSLQRLWRFPLNGQEPVCLTDAALAASYPAVSPKTGTIAFASRFLDANIWRIDLAGKEPPRRLIESNLLDSCPRISPDGRRIAFRSNRTGNDELWISDANGESVSRLTNFGGSITGNARWSPDGRYLALDARPRGNADVFIVPAAGGAPRQLTGAPQDAAVSNNVIPSFSSDGAFVYFASDRSGAWQIWKRRIGGGPAIAVTRDGGFSPVESFDGKWLYYSKFNAKGLFRISLPAGQEQAIVPDLPPSLWGGWALQSTNIFFIAPFNKSEPGSIVSFNPLNATRRTASTLRFPPVLWDGSLEISRDGTYALIAEVERAGSEIHLMAAR